MEDISFPRGGKVIVSKPEEPQSIQDGRSKKKRKADSDEGVTSEFLFGSKPDKKKSTTTSTNNTNNKKSKSSATETSETNAKHSLLPLGGGGVVTPSHGKGSTAPPVIEALSFSKLSKGTKVLGCIREVQDEFAVVALPNLLTGYILPSTTNNNNNNTPTPLKQCLAAGQVLTVVVQKVVTEQLSGGVSKKRIQVSALPTHVNPREQGPSTVLLRGQITSVEDHGCLVDLGFGRRGFVKFDQVEGDYQVLEGGDTTSTATTAPENKARILQPGRLYDFSIPAKADLTSTSIIPLSLPSMATLAQQLILPPSSSKHSTTTFTIGSLQPGMMVTAKVEAMAKNGLCVTFLGNVFRGAIELGSHLGGHDFRSNDKESLETSWRKLFDHHQHFPARIIAVDVPTKLIRLSLAPHVLTLKPPVQSPAEVGLIVKDCTVVRVDQGIGALLALPKEHYKTAYTLPKKIRNKSDLFQNETFQQAMEIPAVYVHISKAYDEEKKKSKDTRNEYNTGQFAKDFSLGSKHAVRILNTGHWMDGVASGGCAPAILEAHVLTHSDLQPGQVYKQVPICAKLSGGSVLVNLGGSPGNPVRGLIPSPLHLMDTTPANSSSEFRKKVLDTKFAVDAKVDVRVLSVDHAKKKCIVTAKKSLVKCDPDHIITSYQDLQVGQIATGFVSKLDDRAVYVTFYNRVYGKVTAKSLASELGIENHKENYQIGDVVTCRIVKVSQSNDGKPGIDIDDNANDEDNHDDDADVEMEDTEAKTKSFYHVLLSLKLQDSSNNKENVDDDDEDEEGDAVKSSLETTQPKPVHIKAGAILPEKSMKILELFKGKPRAKHFVPGYAVVSVKAKYLVDKTERSSMLPQIECKLPFDQLLDEYEPDDIASPEALDALATRVLRVGKKINQKAIVLSDPHKTNVDHASGIGKLIVVSLRKSLIATAEGAHDDDGHSTLLPTPTTHLYVGALVKGYVAQVDPRHGAFLRFLDGMTGLIPRINGGLNLTLYSTLIAKVQVIDDTVRPYRIMLQPLNGVNKIQRESPFKVGDRLAKAQVKGIQFLEATLEVLDNDAVDHKHVKIRIHASMKEAKSAEVKFREKPLGKKHFGEGHPFFGMKTDDVLTDLTVVWVGQRKGKVIIHVTDRKVVADVKEDSSTPPTFVSRRSQLKAGMTVEVVVSRIRERSKGLQVIVSPLVRGYIPGLELSTDLDVLNNMSNSVPPGTRLTCVVMDGTLWHENRSKVPFASRSQKSWSERKSTPEDKRNLYLSVLAVTEPTLAMEKPARNDVIIGRINKGFPQYQSPALMLALRGGFVARCCITEITEPDEWENMPLGRPVTPDVSDRARVSKKSTDQMEVDDDDDDSIASSQSESDDEQSNDDDNDELVHDGKYVECRVLKTIPKQSVVDVSLRASRLEGDLDDDPTPQEGDTIQAYVVETNKKGCFVRLARHIEGRVTLTELCDGYLPDPQASFPPGRLVVGKVKAVSPIEKKAKNSKTNAKVKVDLDMREATLLDTKKALTYEDIVLQGKYKGTVTRVETYGVFVQIENSKVSGLVHLSECSDKFVKNLGALYNPGDPVKVLVIKKDDDEKKIGFSMKASHFEDDDDSNDDSSLDEMDEEPGVEEYDDNDESADVDNYTKGRSTRQYDDLDSDDENFASKLAARMEQDDKDEDSDGDDQSESDDSEEVEPAALDTNVGFDWDFKAKASVHSKRWIDQERSESESSDDDSDSGGGDDAVGQGSSHKSRKKQALRRREEQEISKRERALADGTADENPETAGDFERLLAGNPNSSELWIRYMAFYLSLADISAARSVGEKALDRIAFQEEREKLNVWTAILTLEHKYGNEETLQKAIERACSQNNPKQVYLRVCEILEKDLSSPDKVSRADAMYTKMCSKFKSKKKVWLAHLCYLLKNSRHDEAHALLKKALLSLASYKHAETMSRFAQFEFEFGSHERARTLFDGIIAKYSKRLDLFFVYVDKEVKFGSLDVARGLLRKRIEQGNHNDKQIKSIFKKWYRIEELHGTVESKEQVKETAREFVTKSSK